MAIRNINFDSAVSGILGQRPSDLDHLLLQASDQLVKCGLSANLGKAVTTPRTYRRGPQKGEQVGSDQFNARSLHEWIENVPVAAPEPDPSQSDAINKELADGAALAQDQLVAIHATLAARAPAAWAKIQEAQKSAQ